MTHQGDDLLAGGGRHHAAAATGIAGAAEMDRIALASCVDFALAVTVLARLFQGREGIRSIEETSRQQGGRLLLVETSTDPDQDGARAFYLKDGFTEEARIRDFYAPGQTKVVFWKML